MRFIGSALRLLSGNRVRLITGALGTVLMLAVGIGGYIKGSASASTACAERTTESILKGERQYEENREETMRLSPDNLDRELSNWMRD